MNFLVSSNKMSSRDIENLKAFAISPDVSDYDTKTADWAINEIESFWKIEKDLVLDVERLTAETHRLKRINAGQAALLAHHGIDPVPDRQMTDLDWPGQREPK